MKIIRRGRYWAVYEDGGELICLAVYKKGAQEIVRRLGQAARIEKLWVVTKPDHQSSLGDILFEASAARLAVNNGLKENEIHAIYSRHDEAVQEAERILRPYENRKGL
jgi:methionyl-tRNA formyltransferase